MNTFEHILRNIWTFYTIEHISTATFFEHFHNIEHILNSCYVKHMLNGVKFIFKNVTFFTDANLRHSASVC